MRRAHTGTNVLQQLAPGYLFLQTPLSFEQFTTPWQHRLPIYLHHCFPVHAVIPLNDLSLLKRTAKRIAPSNAIVQIRSSATDADLAYPVLELQHTLNGSHPLHSTTPPIGQVLSILLAPTQDNILAYLGVSRADQNLSPWAGGQIPITECVPNRAGYKLLEALDTFGIRLRRGDRALDLGASPGAWTTLLRRRGMRVTAVAPTPLYQWLRFDSGVQCHPTLAETFLGQCQTTFDLIVNDMKLAGQDSARLMVAYAQHLRREGIAIMTLKLRERNQKRIMDHSFRILRNAYKIIRVRQLVSNRKEVTLFLRRKE